MELRKKILALVEGQTEEALLTRTLGPHLLTRGVLLVPTILTTKRPVAGPSYKGGTVPWRRIKAEARNLLGDTSANLVTTMLDYYGLPDDLPGFPTTSPAVKLLEIWVPELPWRYWRPRWTTTSTIDGFYRSWVLHEFETLLYSAPRTCG